MKAQASDALQLENYLSTSIDSKDRSIDDSKGNANALLTASSVRMVISIATCVGKTS